MADEPRSLSLNERHHRLVHDLNRSRPPNPNPGNPIPNSASNPFSLIDSDTNLSPSPISEEVRVRKVKVEGCRRLCKLSSAPVDDDADDLDDKWLDSPPRESDGGGGNRDSESIRGILDDLTSRMDSLSVEQHKRRPKPVAVPDEPEPTIEYTSASSSFSPTSFVSMPADRRELTKKAVEAKSKSARLFLEDDSDDDYAEATKEVEDCSVVGGSKDQESKGEVNDNESDADVWCEDSIKDFDHKEEKVDGDDFMLVGTGGSKSLTYKLSGKIAKMLFPHQRDGLNWLWALHCSNTGGILGDDMGLGKTMQISAFLAGLFDSNLIKRALIVAPKTLLAHWTKELSVVGLRHKIRDYSQANATSRHYELKDVLKEGGILLTTYDILRNNSKSIRGDKYADEDEILWDYIILDEGHIIKNPKTQRAKSLTDIPSVHRIIISGTPIQNNLKELWALFSFCCPEILGDKDMFKIRYEHPILRGNDKNASDRDKHIGSTVAKELRERIKPYFLRRLKSEVFLADGASKSAELSKKNEIIVWLKLTACQRQLYEAFLNSELVHSSMVGSPLAALTILKKICDHPMLLTKKGAEGVLEGMDTMLNREELSMVEDMATNLANMDSREDNSFVDHSISCKIFFIISLLEYLIEDGHTLLIFSQTRKMLNLIQEAITSKGYKFLRIDGTTKISDREKIVKEFQEGSSAPIFLLTSQVGGLGLTLTRADRVIVVDPAWNPSTDNQSVDRAYRIGQKKDVLVYRLMTCGTIEEKIYKMQVFKGGLFRTATEEKQQTRYFSQKDIQELFSLPPQGFDVSLTQQQLHEEHGQQNNMDENLMKHVEFLQTQGIAGISNHSLLFSKTAVVPLVPEDKEVQSSIGNQIIRGSTSGSYTERPVDGAVYAFKPKDDKFTSRPVVSRVAPKEASESPEDIERKIKRLSQTLENKALLSKLPDSGEKIRKQISDLNIQLRTAKDATQAAPLLMQELEVISIDDLTDDLQKVVYV